MVSALAFPERVADFMSPRLVREEAGVTRERSEPMICLLEKLVMITEKAHDSYRKRCFFGRVLTVLVAKQGFSNKMEGAFGASIKSTFKSHEEWHQAGRAAATEHVESLQRSSACLLPIKTLGRQ